MWFGVAPAPAPSPRTNTKAWHPPRCTCVRHRPSANAGMGQTASTSTLYEDARVHCKDCSADVPTPSPVATRSRFALVRPLDAPVESRALPTHKQGSGQALGRRGAALYPHENSHIAPHQGDRPRRRSRFSTDSVGKDNSTALNPHAGDLNKTHTRSPSRTDGGSHGGDNNTSNCAETIACADGLVRASQRKTPKVDHRDGTILQWLPEAPAPSCDLGNTSEAHNNVPVPLAMLPTMTTLPRSRRGSRGHSRAVNRAAHAVRDDSATEISGHITLEQPSPIHEHPTNLVGHTSSVGVVLVHDDRFIVSASIDGSVKIWSRDHFDCLHTLFGHIDSVSCIDLSTRWLVSGSHDATLRVYDRSVGFRFVHSFEGHSGHVTRVHLLTNASHRLLSCSDDATMRLWDIHAGDCVAVFSAHTSRITCLLSRGERFCTGAADASICFWDLPRCVFDASTQFLPPLRTFHVHTATVQCLLAAHGPSEDGSRIFSSSNDGTVHWFDSRTVQHLGRIDGVKAPIYSMVQQLQSGHLVCSTGDGRLVVYADLGTLAMAKRELKIATKWISCLQLLHGSLVACGSEDQLFIVDLDPDTPRIQRILETSHGFINCVRWLAPGRIVTSGEDNIIKVWPLG